MVLEIVKQAVQIKMSCHFECPLISEAEYVYACARALRKSQAPPKYFEEMGQAVRVEELRERLTPYFQEGMEKYAEDAQMERLFRLLLRSRVEGSITEEIRKLAWDSD